MVAALVVAFCASVANAGYVNDEFVAEDSYSFFMYGTDKKSGGSNLGDFNETIQNVLLEGFKITVFDQSGGSVGFMFEVLNDFLSTGKDGIKIQPGSWKLTGDGVNDYFSSLVLSTGNQEWDPITKTLVLKTDKTWEMFAENIIEKGLLGIEAHLQSINLSEWGGKDGASINVAKFEWRMEEKEGETGGEGATTPEPATMLLFGLGVAVLPLTRRFRNK